MRRILIGCLLIAAVGCSKMNDPWSKKPGPKVLVTFPALASLTQAVAGDDANVVSLLTSEGPHDYHVNPKDALLVKGADVFICNGLELDNGFASRLIGGISSKKIPLIKIGEELPIEALKPTDPSAGHVHGEYDPHVWLNPLLAARMVEEIADILGKLDEKHKPDYQARSQKLQAELNKLHEYGLEKFKDKKNKTIVTSHDSLGYFGDAFKLKILAIRKGSGVEAAVKEKADLIKACKDKQASVITYEPQYPKAEAESLQKSLQGQNVEVIPFDTLETARTVTPDFYLSKMKENIDTLAGALP